MRLSSPLFSPWRCLRLFDEDDDDSIMAFVSRDSEFLSITEFTDSDLDDPSRSRVLPLTSLLIWLVFAFCELLLLPLPLLTNVLDSPVLTEPDDAELLSLLLPPLLTRVLVWPVCTLSAAGRFAAPGSSAFIRSCLGVTGSGFSGSPNFRRLNLM